MQPKLANFNLSKTITETLIMKEATKEITVMKRTKKMDIKEAVLDANNNETKYYTF